MDWALENWFWILIFVLFIAMHMFGHGGHGGHSGHGRGDRDQNANETEKDLERVRPATEHSGEHHH